MLLLACAEPPAPAPTAAPAPPKPTAVRVALNWYPEPEFGGFYAAALAGLYEKAGLAVEILPGGPGVPVLEMLQAGRVEVAITGADDLLLKRGKGLQATAVWASFQHSPVGLLVHDPGPKAWSEVRGPVAVEAGSPFQQFAWGKMGWEGKVEMVPTTGSLGPFAADPELAQQAYVTSEPCVAEGQGLKVGFLPAREVGWDPYAGLVVVADPRAPWVEAFVEASAAGWRAYLADPTAANAEISKLTPQMPPSLVGCVTERQKPYVDPDALGKMSAERWQAAAAALVSVGQAADATGAWTPL